MTFSFCEPYIEKLADYIKSEYIDKGKDLGRLAIVFGGKRPRLFLRRQLARTLKKSFYPPQFFTIDEFISYTVHKKEDFKGPQDLDSCYLLYQITKAVAKRLLKGRHSFAQFLPWAREILHFIDQLDLENVDEKKLLNLRHNAQIGYDVPDDINDLLARIVKIRAAYHKKLKEMNVYSRGFQYLRAAEIIDELEFDEFDQVLFCNFFYFNRSEETVVKSLFERDQATLIFQGDERKWPVLERISRRFECDIQEGEKVDVPQFDLKLYAGFDIHSQVGLARQVLAAVPEEEKDKTVVVLPDSGNLIPLLSELTTHFGEFNVSMGYPLNRSSLFNLFEFIFRTQLTRKQQRYYARDYLKVIQHPFIKNLQLGDDGTLTRIFVHKIEEVLTGKEDSAISGSLFIDLNDIETNDEIYKLTGEMAKRLGKKSSRKELETILTGIHDNFFRRWEGIDDFESFATVLKYDLDMLLTSSFLKKYPLNLNIADKMYQLQEEITNASFSEEVFTLEEMVHIFDAKMRREMVSFHGSPLRGLQVLGLFETRSLNFENVIVLDTNEGALPNLNLYEPLIPREVMISLNLDRLELEEEIQRYQFMRLISSAKNVHLIYQETKEKERSRFIEELAWEAQKKEGAPKDLPQVAGNFAVELSAEPRRVEKTKEMIGFLKDHTYSASSINTYLRNPMEFYTSYVLGLRETQDLLDEPDARQVGTFVHELLEEAYKPYLNKKPEIDKKFRDRFTKLFDNRFHETFERSMKTDAFLLKSVLSERFKRFLDNESENSERQVEKLMHLEHKCFDVIPLSCGDIKFNYVVDRIDRMRDGSVMIVDYKTGSFDQMPKKYTAIENMELSREHILENIRSFQVPLYFHYITRQFEGERVNAALYNLRTLETKHFVTPEMMEKKEEVNKAYLRALDFVVSEILDPDRDFIEEAL